MSIFERNLAAIHLADPVLAAQLELRHAVQGEPAALGSFAIEPARSGLPTVRFADSTSSFYVHSAYDPVREAAQFVEQQLADHTAENLSVVFGLGLGYQALELARKRPTREKIIIFEPHSDLLYLALCHVDLTELLTRPLVTITSSLCGNGPLLKHLNSAELAALAGIRLVSNPAFDRLPMADQYKTAADRLRYEMMAVGGNLQTLMVMGEMQQMNILLNFPHILDNPPFGNLVGRFQGRPAVIVSAGPSLEKNMHLLAEVVDKALIIAVDTATKPLLLAGLTPHIVVTGDPQEANAKHLWDVYLPQSYLVAEPQSPVSAVERWTGPKFICSFHDNMMQWVDRVLGDRGRLHVWGSVAVMAYDCAVRVGADPIIFIGQDLSFPGGRTYAGGTYFETDQRQDMTVEQLRREGTTLIEMEDIHGEKVLTNRQMFAYFNYLSDQFWSPEAQGRTIINATEGGILKGPRVTLMPFAEAIAQYMQQPCQPWEILSAAHALGSTMGLPHALTETEAMLANLRGALEGCKKGVLLVEKALACMQEIDGQASELKGLLRQMEQLRLKTFTRTELMRIVEMANHAGIFAFTQGLHKLSAEEEDSNEHRVSSCYHHHTLYSSTAAAVEKLIPLFEFCRQCLLDRLERSSQTHGTASQVGRAKLAA